MTLARIQELRTLANQHRGHKSAMIIHECLDELEKLQHLYCLNLDACFGSWKGKAGALKRLKALAVGPSK